jgi:hypothetical protein
MRSGRAPEGLSAVDEALVITSKTGECMHQADLYRLHGELLSGEERGSERRTRTKRARGAPAVPSAEAEGSIQTALEVARRQSAKSLELRAAMSLCRLWQMQGKAKEARQMLAETCGWFTEGHGTQDPRDAKALLAELKAASERGAPSRC